MKKKQPTRILKTPVAEATDHATDPVAFISRAERASAAGEAVEILRQGLKIPPRHTGLLPQAALAATRDGDLDQALALHCAALEEDYYPAASFRSLADALCRAGRTRDAEILAAKTLEAFTDMAPALHTALEIFHRTKNAALFRSCYHTLTNSASLYKRFSAEIKAGDFKAAFETADRILVDARHLDTRRFLNLWGDDTGRGEDVKKMLDKNLVRLEAVPAAVKKSPWYSFFKATLLFRSDSPGLDGLCGKIRSFDREKYGWMRAVCGKISLHADQLAQARQDLEAALSSRPREWMTRCLLAETLACQKKYGDAIAQFDRVLDEIPSAAGEVLCWKGEIQLWAGEYEQALQTLDLAVKAGSSWAYCWRGAAKVKTGDHAGAVADLERALKFCRTDAEAFCWLGEDYRLKGRDAEALKYLAKAIELNFHPWAYANRALIRAAGNDKAGFEKDFSGLPELMVSKMRSNLKLKSKKPDYAQKQRIVAACFNLSRGNRRARSYEMHSWLP